MSKKIIGLTGGIGSGKSTVASQFKELGIEVIDSDKIARDIVKPKSNLLKKIVKKFGVTILKNDRSLNRNKLRSIVFSDNSARIWLEKLLHPVIIKKMIYDAKLAKSPYCIIVIPLLFEAKLEDKIHHILVVDAPIPLRIKRLKNKGGISTKDIKAIINIQIPRKERIKKADYIIKNNSTIASIKKQVKKLHQIFLNNLVKKA